MNKYRVETTDGYHNYANKFFVTADSMEVVGNVYVFSKNETPYKWISINLSRVTLVE